MRNFTTALLLVLIAAVTKLPQMAGARAGADSSASAKVSGSAAAASAGDSSGSKQRPFPDDQIAAATKVFLATIPDPKLTRLGLHFDRFVDSLQRAAESQNYRFEAQWLPWSADAYEYKQPGVLLFRRGTERLAILLVGESPAAGIFRGQFREAMNLAHQQPAGIVGPVFSGSFPSLGELLDRRRDIKIFGGAASSERAIRDFKEARFDYTGFAATSGQASEQLRGYWESRGISFPRIVELGEAGTEYGASDVFKSSFKIPFPRDLSVLRRAYESDQQLAKSLSQQTPADTAAVQISKADEPAGGDSVPPQSATTTAATQELGLQTMARSIREGHYGLGTILATNVLDTLFLRQYMASHAPDLQFVLFEPDVLFLHPPEVNAFHGSLAVSRYPMFSTPLSEIAFFPSSASDGIYEAARAMFATDRSTAAPGAGLWVTIIGLDGYWPVAHLGDGGNKPMQFRAPSLYLANFAFFVAALWTLAAALFRARQLGPKEAPRRWFADYTFDAASPLNFARRYHAFSIVISLSVLILVLARPLEEAWGRWVYLLLAPALYGIYTTRPGSQVTRAKRDEVWFDVKRMNHDRRRTPIMALAVVVGGGIPILMLYFGVWTNSAHGWNHFAAYRSMYFGNGVNPTLPLMFAALAVVSCSWYHFQRFIFASERFIPLALEAEGDLHGPYERVRNILAQYATRPAVVSAFGGMALVLGLALLHPSSFTIEGRIYDWMFIIVLAISSGLTMLSVCQFLQTWWHLNDFLRALGGLPMQQVFHDLPRELGSVALFHSGLRQRTLLYTTRCRDLIRKLQQVPAEKAKPVEDAVTHLLRRAGADERETARESAAAQLALMDVQQYLLEGLQRVYWANGQSECLPEKDKPSERLLAEEFVALRFVGFIRYATVQLRNLLSFFSVSFILQAMSVSAYPFFSHSLSQMYIFVAFAVLSGTSGYVLLRMGRDPVLRSLATDDKGSDSPVLWQSLQTASLPLLTFASTYFPELGRALFSWVIPILNSAK